MTEQISEQHAKLLQTFEEKFKQRSNPQLPSGNRSVENAYGVAYQACVAAGLRPQIKMKYRG